VLLLVSASVGYIVTRDFGTSGGGTSGGGSVPLADVGVSKEFETQVVPHAFVNRIEALRTTVAATIGSAASVSSVGVDEISTALYQLLDLDTPDGDLGDVEMSLKVRSELETEGSGAGSKRKKQKTSVSLKLSHADRDFLLATSLGCTAQYAAHCSVKVEQNFYDRKKDAARTIHQRSARVEKLPSSTALSSAAQLWQYFSVAAGYLPPAQSPLLVEENRWMWRAKMPFALTDGTTLEATLDLYYATPAAALQPDSVPLEGSELSFKLPPGASRLIVEAHAVFEVIRSSAWSEKKWD